MAQNMFEKRRMLSNNALQLNATVALLKSGERATVIRVDIPLFIRLLEHAREEAKNDIELHDIAEKLSEVCLDGTIARMRDYEKLFKESDSK